MRSSYAKTTIRDPYPLPTPAPSSSHPLSHSQSQSTSSSQKSSHKQQQQFHRRQITNSSIPSLPKPSHKPPSTSNDFRGDLKSQDVFAAAFKKRNDKLRILFPGMGRFEMECNDMWNHDSICTPCLIIQPKSNREVSDALTGYTYGVMKCLSTNRKQNTQLVIPRLTIAGGRNSINAMRDGCIVLDMSRMRSIRVDSTTRECKIQGGVRVIDLDATLSEYGLIAMSSIFQNMGVVGSILSGGCGFGYASRKLGLACDNVLEAEIVLADGRLKRCSKVNHPDLFYSLCGGGGGFGVVVSVTLQCHPLLHAALLTYSIPTSYKHEELMRRRWTVLENWSTWLHGDVDDNGLSEDDGVNDDIYSQITLPTKQSSNIQFVATSIDEKVIPQTNGFIEEYEEAERKSKRKLRGTGSLLARLKNGGGNSNNGVRSDSYKQYASSTDRMKAHGWDMIPGLADLITNKFGASTRNHVQFRMVRYADQLQSHSNKYFTSGNIYIATKYAKTLSARIIEILVQATLGENTPNNESNIYLHSLGGNVGNMKDFHNLSFNARHMKYVIFIEGKWGAVTGHKHLKEKEKVTKWVNWVANQLHKAEGIQSTTHPESTRDQVSKSGRTKPPNGWYNFDEISGRKLMAIKQKRDPKNVFSLASRISWQQGTLVSNTFENTNSMHSNTPVKDGEIDPTDCLTPKKIQQPDLTEAALESLSSDDADIGADSFNDDVEEEDIYSNAVDENGSEDDNSVSSDLKRLLTISDSDDEVKDWSFTDNVALGLSDLDNVEDDEKESPKSTANFDASF